MVLWFQNTFKQQIIISPTAIQTEFHTFKALKSAQQFIPYLSDNKHTKPLNRQNPRLKVMEKLDFDLLCRGSIGFIQHPMSLDLDAMDT